jgi:flagellar basal body-associated protein FliL
MKSLVIRLMLLAVCFIASGIAVYFVWTSETYTRQSADGVRAFDQAAHEAERAVLDVRAAQHAYVAAGQDAQAWITKAAASVTIVKAQLDYLRAHAVSQQAQNAIDNAASALEDFDQIDRRARDYVRNGQPLLASDAIFADGTESTSAIAGSVEAARAAEAAVHADEQAATRRAEGVAIAAAAVVVLVTILLFAFSTTAQTHQADAGTVADGHARMMPMNAADWLRPGDRAAAPARADAASEPAASTNINFGAVASVCADLARVVDTHALPPLLGRAAELLDAPGIVLWIADPDGRELSPIVTHGYSQSMVLRLGTILRDDENATAAALRTSLLQTVDTDAVSNGAIAAPLVTPGGCVGIMAAEVRHHGEKDPAKLAAASIIAAQLATLVGPPSTRAQARADAV